ncbi:MAG: nicotinate (nicotinamide) nucleotide adenylyltransferase [Acidobacteriaceae bacterium]
MAVQLQSAIMRIGFFGGSFDPPHLGHLSVSRAAANAFALDRVLLAPTGMQPLKPGGATASFEDRLAMVSLLCSSTPGMPEARLEASALDAPREDGSPNYTVDALSTLKRTVASSDRIFIIVGVDAFLGVRRWKSSRALFDLGEWIVVSRPGFSSKELASLLNLGPKQLARVHLLEHLREEASATNIRALIAAGSDCLGLLPASILQYIRGHHLYGA